MNCQLYWSVNSRLAYYESMKRNAPIRIESESDTLAAKLRRLVKRMPRERRVVLMRAGSAHA